jgi:hypothetical protein
MKGSRPIRDGNGISSVEVSSEGLLKPFGHRAGGKPLRVQNLENLSFLFFPEIDIRKGISPLNHRVRLRLP